MADYYFSGGGFKWAASSDFVLDPSTLIRHQAAQGNRFLVVVGNYRLNVLGWLASKDLSAVEGRSGNYGRY